MTATSAERVRFSRVEVAVHAIGDRAVTEALAAFEDTGARGGIEHVQLTTRDDVRRMARLGVRASVQPAHLLDDRDVTERLWPGRAERCFPLRWMLDEGVAQAPMDIDLALITGAGFAFWNGGLTPLLDREGVSVAVTGRPFLPQGVASVPQRG